MEAPGYQAAPEIRGPLVSLLTQWYASAGERAADVDVDLADAGASLTDLMLIFAAYVGENDGTAMGAVAVFSQMFVYFARETEKVRPGNFLEFLRRQALAPFPAD